MHNAQQLDKAGKIVMAAGNPQYVELATKYQAELKRYGVEMEIRSDTAGFATLRALTDDNSGITAGFIKGGLVGSLQGRLATEKAKGRHTEYTQLRSLGRLFYEPVWVFTRERPADQFPARSREKENHGRHARRRLAAHRHPIAARERHHRVKTPRSSTRSWPQMRRL